MSLPSYTEATTKAEFWSATAENLESYLGCGDIARLCRVSRRFSNSFMPLLWRNPLNVICSGNSIDKAERLQSFLHSLAAEPQKLVEIIDFRPCQENRAIPVTLVVATEEYQSYSNLKFEAFPNLKFVIIDDTNIMMKTDPYRGEDDRGIWNVPVNSSSQSAVLARSRSSNILFSAVRCPYIFSVHIVQMAFCYSTLYLDLSYASDIDKFTRNATLDRLSRLRILKLRGTRLTNSGLKKLGQNLEGSLWSLDVRDNLLSMEAAQILGGYFGFVGDVPERSLPANWMAANPDHLGSMINDPTVLVSSGQQKFKLDTHKQMKEDHFVTENSLWNPPRYFADPPTYDEALAHETEHMTLVGNFSDFRPDNTDGVMKWFDEHPDSLATHNRPYEIRDGLSKMTGLTHLYISGNQVAAERFFHHSKLQLLHCVPPPTSLYAKCNDFYDEKSLNIKFNGQTFNYKGRCKDLPFNLEVLRIHHSFITQTSYISSSVPPSRKRIELEEKPNYATSCLGFRPNQNPRLRELTLTDVPPKSFGRVTDNLKFLIHFAADQEVHLKEIASLPDFSGKRAPKLFPGLRVIRLEFRKEVKWVEGSATGDVDAETFAFESQRDFTFFDSDEEMNSATTEEDLADVLDVVEELRKFRQATMARRIESPHWTGTLQCVT